MIDYDSLEYPHKVECYLVREDKRPEDDPIEVRLVSTSYESEETDRYFEDEYPGCWIRHIPID